MTVRFALVPRCVVCSDREQMQAFPVGPGGVSSEPVLIPCPHSADAAPLVSLLSDVPGGGDTA